ncbi:MAG: hypothetical protein JWM19_4858, partial [Actinomycetia bacterium]|nr:hypothetical protein [Actinomycetes bacterium]
MTRGRTVTTLRTKATVGTFLVLAAAGYLHASHATGHHSGSRTVLTVVASGMPANEHLANQMAAARGWDATQQACLDRLWT